MKKIGILGGTFDPIHEGHVMIAQTAYQQLQLDQVEFIPCFQPPHRTTHASAQDRFNMVALALKNHPHFHANDTEIKKQGISYTIDTIHALKKTLPDAEFFYIIGEDAFSQLHTWKNAAILLREVKWVVVNRDHATVKKNPAEKNIIVLHIDPIPFSATKIRQQIHAGEKNIAGLPDAVSQYIQEKLLYR